MDSYLEVKCLVCNNISHLFEDLIEQPGYKCSHCGTPMAKSQWRRAKVNFYVAEELLRQTAAALGNGASACEVRLFDVACRCQNGLPVTFGTTYRVTDNAE